MKSPVLFSLLFLLLALGPIKATHIDSLAPEELQLKASKVAGFYGEPILVELTTNLPGAQIYYTTNGQTPSNRSHLYKQALRFDTIVNLQAIAYLGNKKSQTVVNTYFVGERKHNIPVISITIEPNHLFNPVTGLFMKGPNAQPILPYLGANFNSRREVPCHVEFFETNQQRAFGYRLGLSIFGGFSRAFPQKSLALYARAHYGTSWIRYQVFPDKDLKKFKRLVLRNSGSDYGETHFRDAFMTSLGKEMGLDVQAYRPSAVFINGRYWGLLNIREKLTKHYLSTNFGVSPDSLDLLEHRGLPHSGSKKHYTAMQEYMQKYDLAKQEHFDYITTQMDVYNFMEYQIMQIYIDNQDAGGNIKFWRPQTGDGRWRWLLFDTDYGFGHYTKDGYKFNSLEFHTAANGPNWPNPPWSTFNLRNLLKNEGFRDNFITRFCDRMNSTFEPSYVNTRIDSMANRILDELPYHWKRWDMTAEKWKREVNLMKDFGSKRPEYMRQFLKAKFPYIGEEVQLDIAIDSGGRVLLNGVITVQDSFSGIYFQNLTVSVKPKPYFGYLFSHWLVDGREVLQQEYTLRFNDSKTQLKAVFKRGEHPMAKRIIINEISSRDSLSGDWIEFYNSSDQVLNLAGWTLQDDENNLYTFGSVSIEPKGYLVLCQDAAKFKRTYRVEVPLISNLNFGLGKRKEELRLYDHRGEPVDSVGYKIKREKDEEFFVFALRDFELDNSDFETNWKLDKKGGSPGSINPQLLKATGEGSFHHFLQSVKVGALSTCIFVLILLGYIVLRRQLETNKDYD